MYVSAAMVVCSGIVYCRSLICDIELACCLNAEIEVKLKPYLTVSLHTRTLESRVALPNNTDILTLGMNHEEICTKKLQLQNKT